MLIGIDWGGTKIEAVALMPSGEVLTRRRVPAPRTYAASLAAAIHLVEEIERDTGQRGSVGVGIPGAMSAETGLVKNANSTWLIGEPLDSDLSAALGRPVRVENDADCFAVSEAVDGAGAGAGLVWGVILGTGCGSGIALDGHPLRGRHRIAGEWGHNPLPRPTDDERPGPLCYCGRHGCQESFVSGPGFSHDHAVRTGQEMSAAEIVAAMRAGDAGAGSSFDRLLDRLGRGMASVVNLLDPDVIVIGGGLSNIDELYRDLPDRIRPHVFSDAFTTPILRNRHGDSSGVRGAAWLWKA